MNAQNDDGKYSNLLFSSVCHPQPLDCVSREMNFERHVTFDPLAFTRIFDWWLLHFDPTSFAYTRRTAWNGRWVAAASARSFSHGRFFGRFFFGRKKNENFDAANVYWNNINPIGLAEGLVGTFSRRPQTKPEKADQTQLWTRPSALEQAPHHRRILERSRS